MPSEQDDTGERRSLAAIMFTDLVGFTSITQADERYAMELLQEQTQLVRPILKKYGGKEVKTIGDAFLVEFPNALDAVRCAVKLQEENRRVGSQRRVEKRAEMRIGLHIGDVIHRGGDIFGDAVNISSRIEPLASPGGVCISEQVFDQVRNKINFRLVKLQAPKLKNVNLPIDVYSIEMPWDHQGDGPIGELDRARVAVLPLANLSPDPNDEYFSDGMTEELITSLSGVTGFTVIARTSVMPYKTAPKRVMDIGRELNVGTIIEGSVRKAGNKVRISVQVIDARNEGHLWASNYDRELNDIFAVQGEIAEKVAESVKMKLLDSDKEKIARSKTVSPEAHTLYLKGRYYWNLRSREGINKAIEYFKLAIEQDEEFAAGYSGLAQCYAVMGRNQLEDPRTAFPIAKDYVSRSIKLDPDSHEARTCLANILHYYDFNLRAAETEFRKAIELNPNYPTVHQWFSHLLMQEGRRGEAFDEITKALGLDPLSRVINLNFGDGYYYLEQYDKAMEQFKKILESDPNFALPYLSLAKLYEQKDMYDEALSAAEKYGELSKKIFEPKIHKAHIYAAMGNFDEARKLLSEAEENYGTEIVSPFWIGAVHYLLGELDACFEWLNKAYNEHDTSIMQMICEQDFKTARREPRFLALLQKVGLSEWII